MKGSERRKAPQLSATQNTAKPDSPLKGSRTERRVRISKQTDNEIKRCAVRLFGVEDVSSFIRLAIAEKIQRMTIPETSGETIPDRGGLSA